MQNKLHRHGVLPGLFLLFFSPANVNADRAIGSVFHFTDELTNEVVMQAEFPAAQVCEFFKQMALDEPQPQKYKPVCSSNLVNSKLPVSAVVDYGQLGFSVPYRFNDGVNCEEFVREFKQTIIDSDIEQASSRLVQDCSD